MLVDTDVFIWYLRGNEKAYDIIMNETDLKLSVVTGNDKHYKIIKNLRLKTFRP